MEKKNTVLFLNSQGSGSPSLQLCRFWFNMQFTWFEPILGCIYKVRTLKFEIKDLQADLDKVQPPPQKKRRGKEKYQEFKFQN